MAYYFGNAVSDIRKIKGKSDGHLDISSLPVEARKTIRRQRRDEKGQALLDAEKKPVMVEETGRDIGMMVSVLTKAIQELDARIDKLEAVNGQAI